MKHLKKSKLIAQYWGQEVVIFTSYMKPQEVNCTNINASNSILKLYEPHSVTDSEAKIIAVQNKFNGSDEAKIKVGRDILKRALSNDNLMCLPQQTVDFMRSNGYALPFCEYDIAYQVHNGYVTLITRTEQEKVNGNQKSQSSKSGCIADN